MLVLLRGRIVLRPFVTIATVFLVVTSVIGIGAATYSLPKERLVEGHAVFTTIQPITTNDTDVRFAAAVAVLVRESKIKSINRFTFPGVLWFNDQYLVDPYDRSEGNAAPVIRYPCSGAVLAVNAGDPDPRNYNMSEFNSTNYNESYHITDPNQNAWDIDKWVINSSTVWSVAIAGSVGGPGPDVPDNETCMSGVAYDDGGGCIHLATPDNDTFEPPLPNTATNDCYGAGGGLSFFGRQTPAGFDRNPGTNGYGYPCGDSTVSCDPLQYNAVLYFKLEDLTYASTPKNHTVGSANYTNDVSGCQDENATDAAFFGTHWPCPSGDDDREGNSHPFNPYTGYPFGIGDGKGNHGGSDNCGGDSAPDANCHATRKVDIYFGLAPTPITRVWYLYDVEGYTAPFHCHDGMICNQQDFSKAHGI